MKGKKNTAFNFDPAIYDSIFENFFRSRDRVKTFIEVNLTEKIKEKLDLDSLKVTNESLIDEDMIKYFRDYLYEIKVNHKPGFLYIFFAGKECDEMFTSLQLMKYLMRKLRQYLTQNKDTKEVPFILPVLVYDGKLEMSVSECFISFLEDGETEPGEHRDSNGGDYIELISLVLQMAEEVAANEIGKMLEKQKKKKTGKKNKTKDHKDGAR